MQLEMAREINENDGNNMKMTLSFEHLNRF